jgi:hypothetical protein
MVLRKYAEKTSDKIQYLIMIKALKKLEIEGMFFNIIIKHIANIKLNGEKLKSFLLKSVMRQGCLLLSLLFNIVLEFLATTIRLEL